MYNRIREENHWQWWHLIKNSRPMILDAMSQACCPLLQVIDNFVRNHKLGLIVEILQRSIEQGIQGTDYADRILGPQSGAFQAHIASGRLLEGTGMLFLNERDTMAALTLDQVMTCVEEALRIYEEKTFVMPDRMAVHCGDNNLLLLMPCVTLDNIAIKLVTVFPGNKARNRPVIDGLLILSDRSTGEILALMDGKTITAMRTGAVTGVSIRHLSRADAHSVWSRHRHPTHELAKSFPSLART